MPISPVSSHDRLAETAFRLARMEYSEWSQTRLNRHDEEADRLTEVALRIQGKRRMVMRPDVRGCDICGRELKGKQMHYDHDHQTGYFRGWLCLQCNSGLGMFQDSPRLLTKAIHYLSMT